MSASIGKVCGDRRLVGGRGVETVVWFCTVWSLVTLTLGFLVGPLAAQAQQTGKLYRIGFLGNSTAALEANLVGPFREGLRELGYVGGKTSSSSIDGRKGRTNGFPPSSRSCFPERWR